MQITNSPPLKIWFYNPNFSFAAAFKNLMIALDLYSIRLAITVLVVIVTLRPKLIVAISDAIGVLFTFHVVASPQLPVLTLMIMSQMVTVTLPDLPLKQAFPFNVCSHFA